MPVNMSNHINTDKWNKVKWDESKVVRGRRCNVLKKGGQLGFCLSSEREPSSCSIHSHLYCMNRKVHRQITNINDIGYLKANRYVDFGNWFFSQFTKNLCYWQWQLINVYQIKLICQKYLEKNPKNASNWLAYSQLER